MKHLEIEKIIIKYIHQEANYSELKKLDLWLKDDANSAIFDHFVETEYLVAINLGDYNLQKANKKEIRITKKKKKNCFFKKNIYSGFYCSYLKLLSFSAYRQ
jgi:transmembrane sensor